MQLFLIILLSVAAGFVNGFLGTGGGIVLIFAFSLIKGTNAKDNFATTLCIILIMSVFSSFLYLKSGFSSVKNALPYLIPGALGGFCGAFLLDKLNTDTVKKMFSVILLISGINMLMK